MAVVHDLVVEPQRKPLLGSVPVPSDESVATLALVIAALAEGTSEVRRLSFGTNVTPTRGEMASFCAG